MASIRLFRATTAPSRFRFGSSSYTGIMSKIKNIESFGDNREKSLYREHNAIEKKPLLSMKAATAEKVMITEPKTDGEVLVRKVKDLALILLKMLLLYKRRAMKLHPQIIIEKIILDCRFFALFGVVGSLVGSILCFLEGSFAVLESYFQYFHALSGGTSDLGHVVELLLEAIDMFLIGTAMLIFGMGLHVMFVGAKHLETRGSHLHASSFFGLFRLQALPKWAAMGSVHQAKSKIGHAMMMMMQVGLLEKFKSIPLTTGLDLACFAGAIFVSSISMFLLSRLSIKGVHRTIITKFKF